MTDRELLELAAKAAGVELKYDTFGQSENAERAYNYWNPLIDDGDALRLAVTLRLTVNLTECQCCVGIYACQLDDDEYGPDVRVRYSKDFDDCEAESVHEATRLAIVRAAAAIGEKMETKP